MKNTQLRNGNKVLHNGVVKTIDGVVRGHVILEEDNLIDVNGKEQYGQWVSLDEIEFIELSEEVLLKCGFQRSKGFDTYINGTEQYCLAFSNEEEKIKFFMQNDFCSDAGCYTFAYDIPHLHNLQNLWFFVTGKELEVSL